MVRSNNKKHTVSSIVDLKQARIERNLKKLAELVNSSPETKERTLEYLKMAKTNAERQKEYKATRKQLNYHISPLAFQALTDTAAATGKTKLETLESLLLGNSETVKQSNDSEINRLNAEIEKLKESTNSKKLKELKQENKELVKRNDWLDQQNQSLESKLKDSERDNLRLKTELEKANKKYQDLINLPVPEFSEFQKNYFVQFGKQADLKGN